MPFSSAMGKGMSQPSEWIPVGSLLFELGNCDIHANRKISFMNEMKRYEIYPRLKGWIKKSFELYCQISLKVETKFCLNFFHFKWVKVS